MRPLPRGSPINYGCSGSPKTASSHLTRRQLAKLRLAVKQGDYSVWEKVKEEVFDYFTRSEDGRLFHPVIMKERTEAQKSL